MKLVPFSKWQYGTKFTVPLNILVTLLNLWLLINIGYNPIGLISFLFCSAITVFLYHLGTRDVSP
jgi:hypothetical protein